MGTLPVGGKHSWRWALIVVGTESRLWALLTVGSPLGREGRRAAYRGSWWALLAVGSLGGGVSTWSRGEAYGLHGVASPGVVVGGGDGGGGGGVVLKKYKPANKDLQKSTISQISHDVAKTRLGLKKSVDRGALQRLQGF